MTKPWWTRALLGRTSVSNPLQEDDGPDAQFEVEWRPLVKRRLFLILGCLAFWVVALEGRLVWVQVVKHEDWQLLAKKQQEGIESIDATRADVRDRNGRLLAYSVGSFELHLNPSKLDELGKDPAVLARDLCAALGDCDAAEEAAIAQKLGRDKVVDALTRKSRQMSIDAAAGVESLIERLNKGRKQKQEVIQLRPKDVRYYPNMDLAAQVVGFVDDTGKGVTGVERQFDELIRGKKGTQLKQVDGRAQRILTSVITPPTPGVSLELSILLPLQAIADRALQDGIARAGAKAGTTVVLDSATAEVLALSNFPTYNLNLPRDPDAQRNRAIQDLYEPGSTFKMVTLGAALNEGVVDTSTVIDTNHGRLMVEGRSKPITEDKGHDYGSLTPEGILVKSSNVGAAIVGMRLGSDLMLRYARAFGIAPASPRDFFSEQFGRVAVPRGGLPRASLATVSYGYGVNATPLQMVTAMNVFATGGVLMRPHLIHAQVDNGVRRIQEPEVVGRVIRPEIAATMTAMFEAVVEDGTGKPAALPRYRVAGKTGTTKKIGATGYSETDYRVSFVGFVPSRHPRFTIIVVVDEPTKLPAYGGAVAAPIFKEIAEASLLYVGEPPSINPPPPIVVTEDRAPAARPPARPVDAAPVYVNAGGMTTMPDLTGLTLRDALRRLPPGIAMDAHGDGVVVSQWPTAGEPVATDRGELRLQRALKPSDIKPAGSGK